MKVTIIGGGSTYSPELVKGFLTCHDSLPIDSLCMMDINPERLRTVGGFAQRIVETNGSPFKVELSDNQREAIRGASYVVTQIRVGMLAARVADEYLGHRHGLIGQETTGVGGMAKALRTIPVILGIAKDVEETTDGALLVNFTNPSGLITEALQRFSPKVNSVGLCNIPIITKMEILQELKEKTGREILPEQAELDTLGLNHLTWHRGFKVNGEDIWPEVFSNFMGKLGSEPDLEWDENTIKTLNMIPNSYLRYYYYTDKYVSQQIKYWPPSRGEQVLEIEKDLLREYADLKLDEFQEDLMKRGGAYYSTAASQLINAHHNNLGQIHVANTRHNGAVSGWPADWVVEIPCRVDRDGVHPIPTEPLPPVCSGLIAQVKAYEQLTAEAAVTGDRRLAYEALLAHPLGPSADKIQKVLDDLLATHKAYLPRFWE